MQVEPLTCLQSRQFCSKLPKRLDCHDLRWCEVYMERILVICTGNAARSQIAEGLFQSLGKDEVEIHSAGTHPAGFIHPLAIETMLERGIDITEQKSKSLSIYEGQRFDYVITVCDDAQQECPAFRGASHQLHWSTPDPSFHPGTKEERTEAFRLTIVSLERRVTNFLEDLKNGKAASE